MRVVEQCSLIVAVRVCRSSLWEGGRVPSSTNTCSEEFYRDSGKLSCGLHFGDVRDNHVHTVKDFHQRGTMLGHEVRLILLNVPPNF